MGSYLSIVNDTQDPWQCKIGPDQAALKIAGIIVSVIGSVATVIATAGAAGSVAAALAANGVVGVFGVSTSAIAPIAAVSAATTYASVAGSVSGFGMAVAKGLSDKLSNDGFHLIAPGQSHRWGKMTLSLWQQGTCVKSVLVNEKTVRVETLYMRPIFSGATKDSNNDHRIQWWINKWGTEKQNIEAHEGGKRLLAVEEVSGEEEEGVHAGAETEAESLPPTDKLFYFYENGTNTYTN